MVYVKLLFRDLFFWSCLFAISFQHVAARSCGNNGTTTTLPQLTTLTYATDAKSMIADKGKIVAKTHKKETATTKNDNSNWIEKPCFAVISDIHIGHTSEEGYLKKMTRVLRNISHYQPAVHNVFVIGDLANRCLEKEYIEMMRMFGDTTLLRSGIKVTFMRGNHDNFKSDGGKLFDEIVKQPRHQYQIIDGYPFISLSNTISAFRGEDCYDQNARKFLSESLADAAKRYPGRPIFVFQHVLPENTIVGSKVLNGHGAYASGIDSIMSKYPQIIDFSGHTHISIVNPHQIYQKNYTAVNDGGERNNSMTNGAKDQSIHKRNLQSLNEGFFVHFNKEGAVILERWNLTMNKKYEPDWIIEPPFDKTSFRYTNLTGGAKPTFSSNAQLKLTYLQGDSCNLFIPQAKDDEYVWLYKINVTDDQGKDVIRPMKQQSLQNRGKAFEKGLLIPIGGLPYDKELTCTVIAEDGYDQTSSPINISFHTDKNKNVSAPSEKSTKNEQFYTK